MSELTVTLNDIRKHSPCSESWQKLLADLGKTKADDTEVSIRHILNLLGLDDALWALRALPESMDNQVRLLVCDLIEPALQYTDDPRPHQATDTARRFANGEATEDELDAARAAARAAAWADESAGACAMAATAAATAAEKADAKDAMSFAMDAARAAARAFAWAFAWTAMGAARAEAKAAQGEVFKAWLDLMERSEYE